MTDEQLIASAQALLDLDARGALVPHGIGGHARTIIEGFLALSRRVPASGGETDLSTRAKDLINSDHARGCEGREYGCDCGYDERVEQVLIDLAAALPEGKAEPGEAEQLRQIIYECAAAIGNGAFIAPTASLEFMRHLPDEIRAAIARALFAPPGAQP